MQTSLLLLYKNMVRGEFPELEVERKVALYKLQARLRLRLSMAIGGRGVLRAASEGGAGDAAPPHAPASDHLRWDHRGERRQRGLPGPAELRTTFLEPRLATPPHSPLSPSAETAVTARGPR